MMVPNLLQIHVLLWLDESVSSLRTSIKILHELSQNRMNEFIIDEHGEI